MSELHAVALYLAALLCVLGGLAGLLYPVLPATPLIFAGLWLAAWTDQYQHVGALTLWLLAGLTLASLILDQIAGALGARRANASAQAIWGALIGSIVGAFFFPLGLLLGPFLGGALGEWIARRDAFQAGRVGAMSLLGFILGALAKVAIAIMMLALFAGAWLWD